MIKKYFLDNYPILESLKSFVAYKYTRLGLFYSYIGETCSRLKPACRTDQEGFQMFNFLIINCSPNMLSIESTVNLN